MEKYNLSAGPSFTDLLIRTGPDTQTRFKLLDIIALQAADKYVKVYVSGRELPLLVSGPLQALELQLFPVFFCRMHKSWVIGLQHLVSVEKDSVILSQRLEVPLSASYRQGFYERYRMFN